MPSDLWYQGRNSVGEKRKKMAYGKENFVQGFWMTPGEYFNVLGDALPLLLKHGLFRKDKKLLEAMWDLYEMYAQLRKHKHLQAPENCVILEYWKSRMIRKFLTSTAKLINNKRHLLNLDEVESTVAI